MCHSAETGVTLIIIMPFHPFMYFSTILNFASLIPMHNAPYVPHIAHRTHTHTREGLYCIKGCTTNTPRVSYCIAHCAQTAERPISCNEFFMLPLMGNRGQVIMQDQPDRRNIISKLPNYHLSDGHA